jgi:hypothetical protein
VTQIDSPLNAPMRIIETTVFSKLVDTLMSDEEKQELLDELITNPAIGKLIKGGAGLRKLRWSSHGRGKRGGTRIIYFWKRAEVLYLLLAYPKNKKDDLSTAELKTLRSVVQKELWI